MGNRNYTCHVCGAEYDENDVISVICTLCKKTACIYCSDTLEDVCDKCQDERMFNPVETQCVASLPKQQIAQ